MYAAQTGQTARAMIIAGRAHRRLGAQLADACLIAAHGAAISQFADGETRVHIAEHLRGQTVFLIQSLHAPVNDHLLELALLADAARAAGAARVVAVTPYLAYARQDQRAAPGDPRSSQVVARLFEAVGIDELITVDLHTTALESAYRLPMTIIPAIDVFRPQLPTFPAGKLCVVSPDAGGLKRAQQFAAALTSPVALMTKSRRGPDQPVLEMLLGDVRGQHCLIVDDMASTGRTLLAAADALGRAGAAAIDAIITHAVFAPGARERLEHSPIGRLITSDTIPLGEDLDSRIEVHSICAPLARLLAERLTDAPRG